MNRKHNPFVSLVALLLAAIILVLTCTGCSTEMTVHKNSGRFTTVRYFNPDAPDCYIITDNETGVQYLFVDTSYGSGLCKLED